MKTKLSIGLIVIIALVVLYFVFFPSRLSEHQSLQPAATTPAAEPAAAAPGDNAASGAGEDEEERRAAMEAAYQKLEAERKALRHHLGILKTDLWDVELPAEEARRVTENLKEGYVLLKNPPLLGAFQNSQEIQREIEKIQAVEKKLAGVRKLLDQVRADGKGEEQP